MDQNSKDLKNMNNDIYRLAKPKKKGILHLLFSRFIIIVLLILLQILVIVSFYGWLAHIAPWITIFYAIFNIIIIIYLFNNNMDSSAKLTWMLLIAIFPLAGAFFLWFTQSNFANRKLQERILFILRDTNYISVQPPDVVRRLEQDMSGSLPLSRYLGKSGCYPIYDNTEVTFFPNGEEKFNEMLQELQKAEHFIFLEYFIIEEGYMWGEILRILVEKAKAGLDVRVMYDGMCELSQLPWGYWKLLEKQGIRAKVFSPLRPVLSSHYNYRDHRKILVIDGKVAFNGGINLADEYINRVERFGYWKDTALMLRGDAVRSFTLMFLQMWNVTEKNHSIGSELPDIQTGKAENPACPQGYVMPYGDCPMDEYKAGEAVYMDILNRAQHYVHIMTPYLILDGEMETSLKLAAQKGVDVRIILPGIPDKKMAYALAKSHYKTLVNAGVKLYEFTPGFVHAKVFTSDDCKAVVGTINLDYRSLYHHFECATYLYQVPCISDIEKDFQETLAQCRQITSETIKNEKLSYRLAGTLMKVLAPLF